MNFRFLLKQARKYSRFEGAAKSAEKDPGQVISDQVWASVTSAWIDDHVRNSTISSNIDAWNQLTGALPFLRTYLEKELKKRSFSDATE